MIIIGFLMMGNVSYGWIHHSGHSAHSFAAGVVVGSVISRKHHKKRRYRKRRASKRYVAPVMTSDMKIQKSLTALGFYHGKLDGEVNSYETRTAIKAMHTAYNKENSPSLTLEERDTLIYLGDLFIFDRFLISRDANQKEKSKKIQAALKIHGFYHDKIDGVIGSGTRRNIAEYKEAKGLSLGTALDYEEEYQLFSTATTLNNTNIDEAVASLKGESAVPNTAKENNISHQAPVEDTQQAQTTNNQQNNK
jgi:hypothetical protein